MPPRRTSTHDSGYKLLCSHAVIVSDLLRGFVPLELAPPVLERYRPRQTYLLLDNQQLAKAGALPERNLCTALFRLAASRGADEALGILKALVKWLKASEQTSLRRAFAVWLGRVFLPKRLPGVSLPPL